jgi:hypothetical protein
MEKCPEISLASQFRSTKSATIFRLFFRLQSTSSPPYGMARE